jgi:uncharacterized membrane protein YqjE
VDSAPELGGSLRQVGATLIEIAQSRLELGTIELAEERERLVHQALAGITALVGLGVGLVLGAMALAWCVGPPNGALVLGFASLAALVAAGLAIGQWQRIAHRRPALLHETLAQLRCDARALGGRPEP